MQDLYLPITSQPRELDAKLLLALFACESGITPHIGYKTTFRAQLHRMSPGYYLAHNARQKSIFNEGVTELGNQVFVLDEEALVRQSDEIFFKKHPKDAFEYVHRVLCWGQDDASMWVRSQLNVSCGTTVVGNPRMDLMRPELAAYFKDKVAELRNTYGNYILLNTNFPTVNNITPQGGGVRMREWALDNQGQKIEQEFLSNKRAIYETLLATLPSLANAIAPLTLVIRPHPNEDHTPWEDAGKNLDNVHVVFEGSVVPWLIGARALVHNNCTTAVEAAVVGTPVLNFRPWTSNYDNSLAHELGIDCEDVDALSDAIRALEQNGPRPLTEAQKKLMRHHIANYDGAFSCERIVAFLKTPDESIVVPKRAGLFYRTKHELSVRGLWLQRFIKFFTTKSGRRKLRLMRSKYPDFSIRSMDLVMLRYSEQQLDLMMRQFPSLKVDDLNNRIAKFSAATNRFSGMRAVKLHNGLVTILKQGE